MNQNTDGDVSAREWVVRIFERGNRPNLMADVPMSRFRSDPNWFRCGDGTELSIIAGWGTYCSPRPGFTDGIDHDYSGPYTSVEAWLEGADDPENISAEDLWAYLDSHGGVTEYCAEGVDYETWHRAPRPDLGVVDLLGARKEQQ